MRGLNADILRSEMAYWEDVNGERKKAEESFTNLNKELKKKNEPPRMPIDESESDRVGNFPRGPTLTRPSASAAVRSFVHIDRNSARVVGVRLH